MRLSAATVAVTLAAAAFAGPISPPPGPVGPSMKTLDEVQPRTPLNTTTCPGDADSVLRITERGSYMLTADLVIPAGKKGIELAEGFVTIDLNGFMIRGMPGATFGIANDAGVSVYNVVVRNGVIRSCTTGVALANIEQCEVHDVTFDSNSERGVTVGAYATLVNARAFDNGTVGISTGQRSVLRGCVSEGNVTGIDPNGHSLVIECNATDNGGDGFATTFPGSRFVNCMASNNDGDGFSVGAESRVEGCSAMVNGLHGIAAGGNSVVVNNNASRNGQSGSGAGVFVAAASSRVRIEGNTCHSNDTGIEVDSGFNLIVGNRCSSNTSNFEIVASNRVGAIVTLPLSPAISGNSGGSAVGVADGVSNLAY